MAVSIPKKPNIKKSPINKVGQPPKLKESIKRIKGIGKTPKKGIS